MVNREAIIINQTNEGWGGFKGKTLIVEYAGQNLGMILASGKFTPVDLLTKVEDLKNKRVTVSEATAGMLALATVPTRHLKPGTD